MVWEGQTPLCRGGGLQRGRVRDPWVRGRVITRIIHIIYHSGERGHEGVRGHVGDTGT